MFCPKINADCKKEQCEWWSQTYDDMCVVSAIERHLDDISTGVTK